MIEDNFKIHVNDEFLFEIEKSEITKLDIIPLFNSNYNLIHNNKSFNLKPVESNFNSREYTVQVNKNYYNIKIENQLNSITKKLGFSHGHLKKPNEIKAPMPGIILNVLVKENEQVKEGDVLLILEAMKMENSITSPKNGIIKKIKIAKSSTVEKGQLLIELS